MIEDLTDDGLFEALKSLPEDKLVQVIDCMPEGQREHLLLMAEELPFYEDRDQTLFVLKQ